MQPFCIFESIKQETLLEEREIIQKCKENDRNAQKILFDKYGSVMFGICLRYLKNRQDAEDLLQDCFILIFDKIDTFNEKSSLKTWMSRIFVNSALNKLRKRRYDIEWDERVEEGNVSFQEDENDELNTKTIEVGQAMEMMNQLPEKYRIVINMYVIDNLSHNEIAKALETNVNSTKSRLSRARKMLRKMAEKNYIIGRQ